MVSATVQSAIEAPVVYARWAAYLDFDGDPLRACTGLYDKTFSGTGDSDLDGLTYEAYNPEIVSISQVQHDEGGSNTVTASMSGLIVNNAAFLAIIGDKTKWQGRIARLWWYVVDENETQIGEVQAYYTGYMSDVTINGDAESQAVTISIEHYLTVLTMTPNKTYMIQKEYDPDDESAAASTSAANGLEGSGTMPANSYSNISNLVSKYVQK